MEAGGKDGGAADHLCISPLCFRMPTQGRARRIAGVAGTSDAELQGGQAERRDLTGAKQCELAGWTVVARVLLNLDEPLPRSKPMNIARRWFMKEKAHWPGAMLLHIH